jgi:hypothetical protein
MKTYDKKIKQLMSLYEDAEQRLIQIITTKTVKGQVTDFYRSLLKQVQQELLLVQLASTRLSKDIVKDLYKEAYEKANKVLQMDISDGYSALHTDAITILTDNLVNNFADVNHMVGRQIEDTLRDIGLTKASTKFATGQTIKELQKELKEKLLDEGIGGILAKNGRVIPYKSYANLLARSIVAETQNTSVLNVTKEHEHDLVKMSNHKTSCPVCQKYEDKIYSISGNSDKYPYLKTIEGFRKGYNNIHPNCRHRLVVFQEKYN